jgi:hypothetical protein
VRFASTPNVAPLAALMREKFADDLDLQLDLFQSVRQGLDQRGQAMPERCASGAKRSRAASCDRTRPPARGPMRRWMRTTPRR